MNNPFEINVHIDLGISPELMKVISVFAPNTGKIGQKEPQMNKKADKKVIIDEPKQEPKNEHKDEPKQKDDAEPKVAENAAPEAKAEPAAEKEYTEQDVRAAMHRTRTRIEGEDYKQHTDSEGYKKWHRQLTAWFKNTASSYGAEKPSAIETSDGRRAFIDDCDRLVVEDDKLVIPLPF